MDVLKGARELAERFADREVGRVHEEIIYEIDDESELLPIYAYLGIKPQPDRCPICGGPPCDAALHS